MKRDSVKPIIDSLLDEVLGELTPPDVTDRVLHALSQESDAIPANDANPAKDATNRVEPPTLPPKPLATPATQPTRNTNQDNSPKSNRSKPRSRKNSLMSAPQENQSTAQRDWMTPVFWMACGAASILLVATLTIVVLRQNNPTDSLADQSNPSRTDDGQSQRVVKRDAFAQNNGSAAAIDDADKVVDGSSTPPGIERPNVDSTGTDSATTPANGLAIETPLPRPERVNLRDDSPFHQKPPFGHDDLANNGDPTTQLPVSLPRKSDREMVIQVNHIVNREIDRQQVMPAGMVGDAVWLRRAANVLLGREPTDDERFRFEQTAVQSRREWFVNQVLFDDVYRGEFSRFWGNRIANELIVSSPSQSDVERQDLRATLARFLTGEITAEQGLDSITVSLLTATGETSPESEAFNPATAYLASHRSDHHFEQLTSDVSRMFLGRRLDCVKCHDHSIASEWKQSDYWELNAFFRQLAIKPLPEGGVQITDEDFTGETNDLDDAVVFFEDQTKVMRAAYPKLDRRQFGISGRVKELNRRRQLSVGIVQSADFRRVIVNRVWAQCFNVGLTRPVDELASHNPVSHPELLNVLSDQFASHGFRLRPLLKWMLLSEPFSREESSSWDFAMDSPNLGRRPLFSRYYRSWSRPQNAGEALAAVMTRRDELADIENRYRSTLANIPSIPANSTAVNADPATPSDVQPLDVDLVNAFLGRTPENPWGMSGQYAKMLDSLAAASSLSLDEKLQHLFKLAVERDASSVELSQAREMVEFQIGRYGDGLGREADEARGLQDVWWTLMLSSEFGP